MSYNILATTDDFTVVSEYIPSEKTVTAYESEEQLENRLIQSLKLQGYEYVEIHSESELIQNLRIQLEKLNDISFTDREWDTFYHANLSNPTQHIQEKTRSIQEDHVKSIRREDGSIANIKLIDKTYPFKNSVQVMHQYEVIGTHKNRYDVTILINGIPLVHLELKRRGVSIKEAFHQINRYQKESFWAGSGLFEFIQIFIISNGTETKYYSNTTRDIQVKTAKGICSRKVSKSFEFTSYWSDAKNQPILDLIDFSKTFLTKQTILNLLVHYCVFTTDQTLMVLRPYQIVAVESILNKIKISSNYHTFSCPDAGGYLFHTTGSGKTLSSFVTAKRVSELEDIDKVLFVVDRKDLDSQTIAEYEKFQKGAVNGNESTKELQCQLEDVDLHGNFHPSPIIVTTIQKLGLFVKKNPKHPVYEKHVVLIFDECHRSQFGDLHRKISKAFKKYHMFGFTGTPIYAKNQNKTNALGIVTTEQLFGERLHAYTIVDAIRDGNVLPFSIDYLNTFAVNRQTEDEEVSGIDTSEVLCQPSRIANNVSYLLKHYDQKTKRKEQYTIHGKVHFGFNSLLACDSIPMAMRYYTELKKQIRENNSDLKVAIIFSAAPNTEEESFDTSSLELSHREFLELAIDEYNETFGTTFDHSSKGFYDYYLNLTKRIKDNEVDITVVVNMLLTGFDSPMTDVLWVDKKLEMHGLIQAFSRTNRILNSIKTYGKIVCFRNLKENVDEALSLYGDQNAGGIVILKTFDDYMNGYEMNGKHQFGYRELVQELTVSFPLTTNFMLLSEKEMRQFVNIFGAILRLRNILTSFDEFENIDFSILSIFDLQNYQSHYLNLRDTVRKRVEEDKVSILDDITFETELVDHVSINIDYILDLIEKYHKTNCKDETLIQKMFLAVSSSLPLRSKKELIELFYHQVNLDEKPIGELWMGFVKEQKEQDLQRIILEENLDQGKTERFMEKSMKRGYVETAGLDFSDILPKVSLFATTIRIDMVQRVEQKLQAHLEKYKDLIVEK